MSSEGAAEAIVSWLCDVVIRWKRVCGIGTRLKGRVSLQIYIVWNQTTKQSAAHYRHDACVLYQQKNQKQISYNTAQNRER